MSEAINIPAEICLLSKSYNNLWNNRRTASTNTEVGVFIKTVYDPCPVGLMVPSIAYYDDKVNKAARWEDWKMGAYTNRVENTYNEKYYHTVRNFSECVYFHTSDTPFKNAAGGVLSTDPKIRHLPILPIRGE